MTRATTKLDIRFVVDVHPNQHSEHGRLDAVAYPIYLEDGKMRNFSSYDSQGGEYADLRIEAWVDRDCANKDDFYWGNEPLSYREIYSLELRRAERIVKTLRTLQKKIEGLNAKFGYPQDFAGYLGYLAVSIGAGSGPVFARKVSGRGWSYDDSEYGWYDVNSLRYYFQDELRKWRGDD